MFNLTIHIISPLYFHAIVRNAGNLVPHSKLYGIDATSGEPAALELGCVVNNVKHFVVCGHSDCKVFITQVAPNMLKRHWNLFGPTLEHTSS